MKLKYLLFKVGIAFAFIGLLCPIDATGQATLMHSYTFESGTANDVVGSVNGTLVGDSISIAGGKCTVKGATTSTHGYMTLDAGDIALYTYSAITLEAYLETFNGANTAYSMLVYFGNNTGGNKCLWIQPTRGGSTQTRVETNNGSATKTTYVNGIEMDDGKLHYVVAVLSDKSLKFYLDGVLADEIPTIFNFVPKLDTVIANIFKGPSGWADPNYNASLEEFNIYEGELPPDSISKRASAYLDLSSDSRLASISPDPVAIFSPYSTVYNIPRAVGAPTVTLDATPFNPGATVTGDGIINITGSIDTVTIRVVSEDVSDTTLYTVYLREELNADCYTPFFPPEVATNLTPDPECTEMDLWNGWGSRSIVYGPDAYCGITAARVGSGTTGCNAAFDISNFAWKANTTYRVMAMVKTVGGSIGILASGTNPNFGFAMNTNGAWQELDTNFTTGATPSIGFFSFNKCDYGSNCTDAFVDNYEIYEVINDATLSALSVSVGTLTPAFSPSVYSYSVIVPVSTTDVDVTATVNDTTADMNGDGNYVLTSGTGTAQVVVTAQSGTVITYTILFSTTYSSDPTLSDISIDVNHEMIPAFDPDTFEYDVIVAYGTDTVNISATTSHPGAEITSIDSVVDVSSGSAIATIIVTAENDTAQATYTLNIAIEDTSCFTPLYSDGRTQYVPDPLMNSLDGVGGWGLKSVIVGVDSAYCGLSCVKLEDPTPGDCNWPNGDAALDLSNFPWEAHTIYRVRAMVRTVGGSIGIRASNSDPNFDMAFDTYEAWEELDTSFTTGANPIAGAGASFFSFNTCDNGSDATATYIDNYEFYKVYTYSSDATLSDLQVDGATVDGFHPDTLSYDVVLPVGTTVVPVVTATANDPNASVDITDATTLPDTAIVVVTAEDDISSLTYVVKFHVVSNDSTLSDLQVNGVTVDGFDPDTLSYDVVLPVGTTIVPVVTATASDPNADVDITDATSLPGTTTIVVTAENGTSISTYTTNFTVASDAIADVEAGSIMIYPTISDGNFTVITNGISSSIKVYDLQGKLVVQQVGGAKQIISLPNAGMYIVKVKCNDVTKIFKVIRIN